MVDIADIDVRRFKELKWYDYKWFGMYPLHTRDEIRNFMIEGHDIFTIHDGIETLESDCKIAFRVLEDADEYFPGIVVVDVSDELYFAGKYVYADNLTFSRRTFYNEWLYDLEMITTLIQAYRQKKSFFSQLYNKDINI